VFPIRDAFQSVSRRHIEVAYVFGYSPYSPLETFLRVVLPNSWGGILTASTLVFAHTMGEFGVVLMLGGSIPGETKTLSIYIYDEVQALNYEEASDHVILREEGMDREAAVFLSFRKVYSSLTVEGEFAFHRGFNVVLGPSGSGKTTLLKVTAGLLKPERGFLRCEGDVLMDTSKGKFLPPQKRKIGLVFQEDNLLPHLNVRENVRFALRKAGHQLSGGERQKVALVRALAFNPRMLLLDEPFSSLDFRIKLDMISLLRSAGLCIPVVVVTHDPVEAFLLGDRVFLMDRGRKVEEGERDLVKVFFSELSGLLEAYACS